MDEFELITFSMEIDEISPVFATQWGMHLAKVTDRKEPEPIPVDQVKEEISDLIKSEKRDDKLKQYIEELREVANIIDEAKAKDIKIQYILNTPLRVLVPKLI